MEKSSVTHQDLEVVYQSWCKLNEDLTLPLYIHIKDIETDEIHITNGKVEFLRNELMIDKTDSPFIEQYNEYVLKKDFLYFLRFIDKRQIFNNCTQSFAEFMYGCSTDEQLYYTLVGLGLTVTMFQKLKTEIIYFINKIKSTFIQRCESIFEYNKKFPTLHIKKDDIDKRYEEYYSYPTQMTMVQSALEYTNTTIFVENKGKVYSEWSWRELQYRTMYIHTKYKIEGFINKVQVYKFQKDKD